MAYKNMLISMMMAFSPLVFSADADLQRIVADEVRGESAQRDQYRHPLQTLTFFDIQPSMTVVEIWPGAGGWYTEILAPYLREQGKFYAAHFNSDSSSAFYRDSRQSFFLKKLAISPHSMICWRSLPLIPPSTSQLHRRAVLTWC